MNGVLVTEPFVWTGKMFAIGGVGVDSETWMMHETDLGDRKIIPKVGFNELCVPKVGFDEEGSV